MIIKKYIKTSLITLALISSLTACGSEEEAPESTSQQSSSSETSQEESNETTLINKDEQTSENNSSESTTSDIVDKDSVSEETTTKEASQTTTKVETTTKKPSGDSSKEETTTKKPTTQNTGTQSDLSKLVKKIIGNIVKSGMSDLEKVLVIHDYITYNIDYDYDNYLKNTIPSTSYSTYGTLTTGRGVCSGYAGVFYELAKEAGLDVKYVEGTANNGSGNGYQGHAWNQVKINGVWYNMDTCWDDATWEGKKSNDHSANNYDYCLVSDNVLYKDHKTNADYVNKCSKNYEPVALTKALAKVNVYKPMVFVEGTGKFEEAIKNMTSAGKSSFSILTVGNGADYWDEITSAIAKLKQPLWVEAYNTTKAVSEYKIGIKEDVCIASSPTEAKKAIEAYKGKLDKLELWYYDTAMNDDNAWKIVDEALYKTGYNIEVDSMTLVREGKVECHVSEVANVLRITDLSEAVSYFNSNGMDALKGKYIWYATKDTSYLSDKVMEAFISSGYLVDCSTSMEKYTELVKFKIGEATKVKYISSAQDLVSYVNSIGLNNLVGKEFYIKISQGEDSYDIVFDMLLQAQCPVDFTRSERGNVIGVMVDSIEKNAYVSIDEADLKNDIMDAKNKGILENAEFWLLDKTGAYSEDGIKAIIDSMNCNIVMDIIIMWYREGYFHMITGARII